MLVEYDVGSKLNWFKLLPYFHMTLTLLQKDTGDRLNNWSNFFRLEPDPECRARTDFPQVIT